MLRNRARLFPVVAVLILGAVAVIALLVATSGKDGDTWVTFQSKHFDYAIEYPESWAVSIREPQPGDDFLTESVVLENGGELVLVAFNFRGGWCESGTESTKSIVVTGREGTEFVCTIFGGVEGFNIVRFFEFEKPPNGSNYYVGVSGSQDEPSDEVKRILDSFRFVD